MKKCYVSGLAQAHVRNEFQKVKSYRRVSLKNRLRAYDFKIVKQYTHQETHMDNEISWSIPLGHKVCVHYLVLGIIG